MHNWSMLEPGRKYRNTKRRVFGSAADRLAFERNLHTVVRPTKSDTVYILSTSLTQGDKRLYKFGITRSDLGDTRIETLRICAYGMGLDCIAKKRVSIRAREVEKVLLSLGEKSKLKGISGATEFRWLTAIELDSALSILNEYSA